MGSYVDRFIYFIFGMLLDIIFEGVPPVDDHRSLASLFFSQTIILGASALINH